MARSHRTRSLLLASLALAVLSACQGPPPNAVPTAVEGAPAAPAPATGTTPVAQAAAMLTGTADVGGQVLADAAVSVYSLDSATAIAAGRTDAAGRFAVPLPALVAGVPLKVVVQGHTATVGALTVATPLSAYQVLAARTLRISLGSTTALLALQPRLTAYGQLTRGSGQASDELLASFDRFAAAIAAVESQLLARPGVGGLLTALGADGSGELPRAAAASIFEGDADLRNVVYGVVHSLNDLLSRLVREHGDAGPIDLGSLTIGNQVYGAVFERSSSNGSAPGSEPTSPQTPATSERVILDPATRAAGAAAAGQLAQDRSLAPFQVDTLMGDSSHASVGLAVFGDKVWSFGGHSRYVYTFTPVSGGWQAAYQPTLSGGMTPYGSHGVVVKGDHVYTLGGLTGYDGTTAIATVLRAAWNEGSQSFTDFEVMDALATARIGATYEVVGDRLYVLGGRATDGTLVDTVETATFDASGVLSPFEVVPDLTLRTPRHGHASLVVTVGGQAKYVLVLGGQSGAESLGSIEMAPIDPVDGTLGAFTVIGQLAADRDRTQARAVQIDNAIYMLSGSQVRAGTGTPARLTDRAAINPVSGVIGAFRPHAVTLKSAVGNYGLTVFEDRLVVVSEFGVESAMIR